MQSPSAFHKTNFFQGFVDSIPVWLGFIPVALVLGAQAATKGLEGATVSLMTGLNFAGGSEFTAINLWTSPPHILLIVAMSCLVNSRHLMMGAAIVPYLNHQPKRKVLPTLFFMCDESWAMALNHAERTPTRKISLTYFMGVSIPLYINWVVFTGLGAVIGPVLGDIEQYGFGMAFVAIFLVLLKGMWKGARKSLPWLVSLVTAAITYLLVPGAWYVPSGAVAGILSAAYWSKSA